MYLSVMGFLEVTDVGRFVGAEVVSSKDEE